uniref:Uncharacterized protein MANES_01G213600 n=1 Tax=Rhizophora mucronata TaxID=61149 RepID=A0A2P2MI32_RHIMU
MEQLKTSNAQSSHLVQDQRSKLRIIRIPRREWPERKLGMALQQTHGIGFPFKWRKPKVCFLQLKGQPKPQLKANEANSTLITIIIQIRTAALLQRPSRILHGL